MSVFAKGFVKYIEFPPVESGHKSVRPIRDHPVEEKYIPFTPDDGCISEGMNLSSKGRGSHLDHDNCEEVFRRNLNDLNFLMLKLRRSMRPQIILHC